jgi:hypothetical protein
MKGKDFTICLPHDDGLSSWKSILFPCVPVVVAPVLHQCCMKSFWFSGNKRYFETIFHFSIHPLPFPLPRSNGRELFFYNTSDGSDVFRGNVPKQFCDRLSRLTSVLSVWTDTHGKKARSN